MYGINKWEIMNLEELQTHAVKIGLYPIENENKENLITRICELECQIAPVGTEKVEKPKKKEKEPKVLTDKEQLLESLAPHINLGLDVQFSDDAWQFKFEKKSDSGTLKQPLINILRCADSLVKA